MNLFTFLASHRQEFAGLLAQHVLLVGASTLAAIAIGVPVGILAARRPRAGAPIVWLANVVQTIPSLAMFGFLLPLPLVGGLGARVAIFVLILYALLPIIRTTVSGIRSVDRVVVEAATALGMTRASDSLAGAVAAGASVDRGGRPGGFGDWRGDRDDCGGCRGRRARRVHLSRALDGRSDGHSRGCRAGGVLALAVDGTLLWAERSFSRRRRRRTVVSVLAAVVCPDPAGRRGERGHARARRAACGSGPRTSRSRSSSARSWRRPSRDTPTFRSNAG